MPLGSIEARPCETGEEAANALDDAAQPATEVGCDFGQVRSRFCHMALR